jgi:hypothetical protein
MYYTRFVYNCFKFVMLQFKFIRVYTSSIGFDWELPYSSSLRFHSARLELQHVVTQYSIQLNAKAIYKFFFVSLSLHLCLSHYETCFILILASGLESSITIAE